MKIRLLIIALLPAMLTIGCNKESGNSDTGTVKGTVTNATTGAALATVRVLIYDANTNRPVHESVFTGTDGKYSITLDPGTYYARLFKQDYASIPATGILAMPFEITMGHSIQMDFEMTPLPANNYGTMAGAVIYNSVGLGGVLIVAETDSTAFTAITDMSGAFWIYNLPPANYTVTPFASGYNGTPLPVVISADEDQQNIFIVLDASYLGTVSGSVTCVATTNAEVDVTLLNPASHEIIPGLIATTASGNYSVENVPAGYFAVHASYQNDGKVMDPDWILKNGEPIVFVAGNSVSMDFNVTEAVNLLNPSNPIPSLQPFETSSSPTFSWDSYASSDDYVIEVSDLNGKVIWGGFNPADTTKNIVIPKTQTSIEFNSDGNALQELQPGQYYHWKVYASKDDNGETRGWKLISASEDLRGLIRISQ